jgi:preprotein translocase subunit Sss1
MLHRVSQENIKQSITSFLLSGKIISKRASVIYFASYLAWAVLFFGDLTNIFWNTIQAYEPLGYPLTPVLLAASIVVLSFILSALTRKLDDNHFLQLSLLSGIALDVLGVVGFLLIRQISIQIVPIVAFHLVLLELLYVGSKRARLVGLVYATCIVIFVFTWIALPVCNQINC